MGEIRIVGPGKTRGYPYPVCKNHAIYIYVIIPQIDEWYKFPTYLAWNVPAASSFLNFSRSNLSLDWVGFFVFFRRTRKVIITKSSSLPMSAASRKAPCPVDVNSDWNHRDVVNLVVMLPVWPVSCPLSGWFVWPQGISQY